MSNVQVGASKSARDTDVAWAEKVRSLEREVAFLRAAVQGGNNSK